MSAPAIYSRREFLATSGLAPMAPQAGSIGRKLHAGAAAVNITPLLGAEIAGNMTYAPAADIHDELHVRSLVLDNGQTRLAFAVVDESVRTQVSAEAGWVGSLF